MVKTVECSDVGFRYGRRVGVAGLSFTLSTGVTGLLGVNGAGKTTLMRILSTLRRPSSGEAFVLGDDISSRKGRSNARRNPRYLPQSFEVMGILECPVECGICGVGPWSGREEGACRQHRRIACG
jgi:ABC-2 type transport system ATP-binding protein